MKRKPKPDYPKAFNFVGQMGNGRKLMVTVDLTEDAFCVGAMVLAKTKGTAFITRHLAPIRLEMPNGDKKNKGAA